jgi:hypothetical protein
MLIPKIPNIWEEGLGMENVGIFYGHLVYFVVLWKSLWLFGIFCSHWVYFSALVFCAKKDLATLVKKLPPVAACGRLVT